MSTPTVLIDAPANINKVIRVYSLSPRSVDGMVNGHRPGHTVTIGLRYTEEEAKNLHRDSAEAAAEAVRLAVRRRDLLPTTEVDVVCTRETLKRA